MRGCLGIYRHWFKPVALSQFIPTPYLHTFYLLVFHCQPADYISGDLISVVTPPIAEMGKGGRGKDGKAGGKAGGKGKGKDPYIRVRYSCSTTSCTGSWYDGTNPPTTCNFCKQPCCWDNPYIVHLKAVDGKSGGGMGNPSTPYKGKGPVHEAKGPRATQPKVADAKLLSASLLEYINEAQAKEFCAKNGMEFISPVVNVGPETQDELNEQLQVARGLKKSKSIELDQKTTQIKSLTNKLEECINKRAELISEIAMHDSKIDDLYPKVYRGDKAHFAKVADQNVDNFMAEGEIRRVNIEAYLGQLAGQVISGNDIQHIASEFAELSKNAHLTVQLTKQSYEQSIAECTLVHPTDALSEAEVDGLDEPILSQSLALCTPTAKCAPTRPGGIKRSGDGSQEDNAMDGTSVEAMQTLAKAKRVVESSPSQLSATPN